MLLSMSLMGFIVGCLIALAALLIWRPWKAKVVAEPTTWQVGKAIITIQYVLPGTDVVPGEDSSLASHKGELVGYVSSWYSGAGYGSEFVVSAEHVFKEWSSRAGEKGIVYVGINDGKKVYVPMSRVHAILVEFVDHEVVS
jgi:hypothetical protein